MKNWPVWWGMGGVAALLAESVVRLGYIGLSSLSAIETGTQVICLVLWTAVIVYAEGHRAFHRRFIPLTVARARALPGLERRWLSALAPLYAMGLIHATRRRLIVSWSVVVGVVILIVAIRHFPAPWRGIVDMGVALALAYGCGSLVWHAWGSAAANRRTQIDPELPVEPATAIGVPVSGVAG